MSPVTSRLIESASAARASSSEPSASSSASAWLSVRPAGSCSAARRAAATSDLSRSGADLAGPILPAICDQSPRQTNLSQKDGWQSYFFFLLGNRIDESYKRCPETGKLLDSIPGLALAFFSVLAPGMHIKAHRGAYKGVVRCHLGLIVPEPRTSVRMRVGNEMVYWEEGKCVIFDDTHKHEVWNDTDQVRVVLLFDVCRPLPALLTSVNKRLLNLAGYLQEARRLIRSQREWEAQSAAWTAPH